MAVGLGADVRLFSIDGSSRSVLAGSPALAGVKVIDLDSVGDRLLIKGYVQDAAGTVRVTVVNSDGQLQMQSAFPEIKGSTMLLGRDGLVSIRYDDGVGALSSTGMAQLTGYYPFGRSIDGLVPVSVIWNEDKPGFRQYGWWPVGAGTGLVGDITFDDGSSFVAPVTIFYAGKLLYLTNTNGQMALTVISPTETAAIPLPGASPLTQYILPPHQDFPVNERWLLLTTAYGEDSVFRVDLQARTAEKITFQAPDGYRLAEGCGDPRSILSRVVASMAGIDCSGTIFSVFRTDDHAAVFTTSDGHNWTRLGGTMTGFRNIEVTVHGDTTVISATKSFECYGTPPSFTSPSAAEFSGDRVQLIRRETGARVTSATPQIPWHAFSRSGRHAAGWSRDATRNADVLQLLDVETGVQQELTVDAGGVHSQPVWVFTP